MTPEEFKLKMATILTECGDSIEKTHIELDKLMCDVLAELGYSDGVEIFRHSEKWYS